MVITALYNRRQEHVADVTANESKYHIIGVDNTVLGHIDRNVDCDGLDQFKAEFELITQAELEKKQSSIFDFL